MIPLSTDVYVVIGTNFPPVHATAYTVDCIA